MKESLAYELPLFSFDIYELSRLAAQRVGLAESSEPTVAVLRQPGLARICTSFEPPQIELHPIFNAPWVPIEVMKHVLIHEHIHRVVPGREVEPGKWKSHPPEFWEMERELSQDGPAAWFWMYAEWSDILKRDEKRECVRVNGAWQKRLSERRRLFESMEIEHGQPFGEEPFVSWDTMYARWKQAGSKETLFC